MVEQLVSLPTFQSSLSRLEIEVYSPFELAMMVFYGWDIASNGIFSKIKTYMIYALGGGARFVRKAPDGFQSTQRSSLTPRFVSNRDEIIGSQRHIKVISCQFNLCKDREKIDTAPS